MAERLGPRFATRSQLKRSSHAAPRRAHRSSTEQQKVKTRKSRPLNLPGSATEDAFHQSVAELLDWVLRMPTFYTTFPAGYGKLGRGMAGKLKAKGMRAGMPDILIFHPHSHSTRVVGLELKVGRNTTTAKQRETHELLRATGIKVYTVRALNDVLEALRSSFIPLKQIELHEKFAKEVVIPKQTSLFEFSPYRGPS